MLVVRSRLLGDHGGSWWSLVQRKLHVPLQSTPTVSRMFLATGSDLILCHLLHVSSKYNNNIFITHGALRQTGISGVFKTYNLSLRLQQPLHQGLSSLSWNIHHNRRLAPHTQYCSALGHRISSAAGNGGHKTAIVGNVSRPPLELLWHNLRGQSPAAPTVTPSYRYMLGPLSA